MFIDDKTAEKQFVGQGRTKAASCSRGVSFIALVLTLACSCLPVAHARAETPEEKGLRIAREASARNDGFGDFTAGMTMGLNLIVDMIYPFLDPRVAYD